MLTHLSQHLLPPHSQHSAQQKQFSPSLCICARYHSSLQLPDAAKRWKNSPHSLLLSQRTKTFGEFSCQLLTGSGLMNEKTFQELVNCIVFQKLFHRTAEDTFQHQHAQAGGMFCYTTAMDKTFRKKKGRLHAS